MKLPIASILSLSVAAASSEMSNMLMAQPLKTFLSDLVSFGEMKNRQKQSILRMADCDADAEGYRTDCFPTDESKEGLRSYLYAEVSEGNLEAETAEVIAATLSLGALYPTDPAVADALMLDGPVQAVYDTTGEGNMVRLGTSTTLVPLTTKQSRHNGIWGYATGQREYALQCHGYGFAIIDVTDPAASFRVQLIPMSGGGTWRDAATHFDPASGKTFAYVGAQGNQAGPDGNFPNLFVIDLSYLSGDAPHGEDSDPIPADGYVDLGYTDLTHTINVQRGLLFLNGASSSKGCSVFDIATDPWNPTFLFTTGGESGYQCHDSYVGEDMDGRDILFISDGGGMRERFYDITDVDASWPVGQVPTQIGETQEFPGIYAHSNWLSEDKRYMFSFEEYNESDIFVHDVSDPENPIWIARFRCSEDASTKYGAIVHNGEVRGKYLFVAYYEAGLRVFDVSNPYLPVEAGKVETHRDPDGDGDYGPLNLNGRYTYKGAWNAYPYLPSGNVLVNDRENGLFVARADPPYDAPLAPANVVATRDASDDVSLNWDAVQDARGYSVERSLDGAAYTMIAEHLVGNSYVDSSVGPIGAYYKINAVNAEGMGTSAAVASPVGVCSNDPGQGCFAADDCCGEGNLFGRRRELQDPCEGKVRSECTGTCTWVAGECVALCECLLV